MALNELDPDAQVIARLMARALADAETIKIQRAHIWALVSVVKTQQAASGALLDLLDSVLAAERDG